MGLIGSDKQYDVRLLQRNLDKGLIKQKDVNKYVKALPDLAEAVVKLEIQMEWGVARQKLLGESDDEGEMGTGAVDPYHDDEE